MITPELVKNRESKKFVPQCVICAKTSVRILKLVRKLVVVCKECSYTFLEKILPYLDTLLTGNSHHLDLEENLRIA